MSTLLDQLLGLQEEDEEEEDLAVPSEPVSLPPPEPEEDIVDEATVKERLRNIGHSFYRGVGGVVSETLIAEGLNIEKHLASGEGTRKRATDLDVGGSTKLDARPARSAPAPKGEVALPTAEDVKNNPLFRAGMGVRDFTDLVFGSDERLKDKFETHVAEGFGSVATFVFTALGTPVLTAMVGSNVNASTQFQDALASGASIEDAFKASEHGSFTGLTEAMPVAGMLRRLDKATGGLFGKQLEKKLKGKLGKLEDAGTVGANALSGAIEESFQEMFVDFANNVSAKDLVGYDPERDRSEGVQESGEVGGTIGFLMNALTSAVGVHRRNFKKRRILDSMDELGSIIEGESEVVSVEQELDLNQEPEGELRPDGTVADILDLDNLDTARRAIMEELGIPTDGTFAPADIPEVDSNLNAADIDHLAQRRASSRNEAAGGQQELFSDEFVPEQGVLPVDAAQEALQAPVPPAVEEELAPETPNQELVPVEETGEVQGQLELRQGTPRGGAALASLERVARSRTFVGEPTIVRVENDGSAIGVGGRTFKHRTRDSASTLKYLKPEVRVFVDIATNMPGVSLTALRTTQEVLRKMGTYGRGVAKRTHNNTSKLESLYKAKTGKHLEDAPRAHLKLMTQYLHGQMGRSVVVKETGVSQEFMDALDASRRDIAEMTGIMVSENMVAGDLRESLLENQGAYIHVTYAANSLLQQGRSTQEVLEAIPEEVRNTWITSFQRLYFDPINNGTLNDKKTSELRRMAKMLGLTGRKVVDAADGVAGKDVEFLRGDPAEADIDTVNRAALLNVLSNHKIEENEVTRYLVQTLHSIKGSVFGASRGRERSIERRRMLARDRDQLRAAGLSEAEIAHNEATRELLMETLDPVTNIGITMNKMMQTIMAHRLVNNLAALNGTGLVSVGKPDNENFLTELLIPRDSPLADIRIPRPGGKPGDFMFATPQEGNKDEGIYVHQETARLFEHLTNIAGGGAGINTARFFAILAKLNLTAGNPRSHSRNTISSTGIGVIRGHWLSDIPTLRDSISVAARVISRDIGRRDNVTDLDTMATREAIDVISEYVTSLGLLNDSVSMGPLKDLATRALISNDATSILGGNTYMDYDGMPIEDQLRAIAKKAKNRTVRNIAKAALELPVTAYRLEDEGMKIFAFMQERVKHAWILGDQELLDIVEGTNQNPTKEQLARVRQHDQRVADYITSIYPTYSRVVTPIRFLSRNIWAGPFPSFNAEMWRNGINDWEDLIYLSKAAFGGPNRSKGRYEGADPARAKAVLGARVAAKLAYNSFTMSMSSAVGTVGATALGLDPTDDEIREAFEATLNAGADKKFDKHAIDAAYRVIAPQYMADSIYDIIDYKPGETITIRNLSFTLPTSQQHEFLTNIAATIEILAATGDTERAADALAAAVYSLGYDYLKQDVLLATVHEAVTGRTQTGYPVWDPVTDDATDKGIKMAKHIAKVVFPPLRAIKEGQVFYEAYRDDRGFEEMLEFMKGVNDVTVRIDSSFVNHMKKALNTPAIGLKANNTKINRLVASNDNMTEQEFVDRYLEVEKERKDAFYQLQRVARVGQSLGLDDRQMERVLEDEGIQSFGGMNLKDLLRDKYKPHVPNLTQALEAFTPKRSSILSPGEKREEFLAMQPVIKARIDIVRRLRYTVQDL